MQFKTIAIIIGILDALLLIILFLSLGTWLSILDTKFEVGTYKHSKIRDELCKNFFKKLGWLFVISVILLMAIKCLFYI